MPKSNTIRTAVGSFYGMQHRLTDMLTDVEGARWTSYRAVCLLNKGRYAAREVAVAKAWTGDVCQRAAYAAQHLHGGIGIDMDTGCISISNGQNRGS